MKVKCLMSEFYERKKLPQNFLAPDSLMSGLINIKSPINFTKPPPQIS